VITATQAPESYLAAFEELNKRGAQPAWLRSLRQEAFGHFCQTGFPTTHDEDWRFTNVSAIAKTPFGLAHNGHKGLTTKDLEPFRILDFPCRLVFVNGRFVPGLSQISSLPQGVKVGSLAEELARNPQELEPHLARHFKFGRDAFSALNTSFFEDGAVIRIPRGVVLEQPVYLLFVSNEQKPVMTSPRNLIVAEESSQATVVEDYVSLGGASNGDAGSAAFSNTATELIAGANAVVSHYMVVREDRKTFNVSTLQLHQERSANVSSHSLLLGGAIVRNNVHPVLAGEGSECLINGLFIGNGRQHIDNYMLVEHASPHCDSRQFYNGILGGRSHGVFHGRIIVHKDAQKTDAKQTNRNILLSDDAQIDTKPQLEIYADDVKCTHGATIGKIEENALFYARSRGMDEESARRMLLLAFANESLDRMNPGPLRDHLETLVTESLLATVQAGGKHGQGEEGDAQIGTGSHGAGKEEDERRDEGRRWEEIG